MHREEKYRHELKVNNNNLFVNIWIDGEYLTDATTIDRRWLKFRSDSIICYN